MKMFIIIIVALTAICTAAYGQDEQGASPSAAFQFDQDRLLKRLAVLKPFETDKGEPGLGYAFVVTPEEFKKSLLFLAEEKANEVMEGFVSAAAFSFNDNTQFLMLTQWKDHAAAQEFIKVEDTLWRLKDEKYKGYIKKIEYEEIDVAKEEKALLTRKTIAQGGQKHDATIFVSVRGNYLFECTLIGDYKNSAVKKLILQIWKIIESEEKKGGR